MSQSYYIAGDWGTSNLRLYLCQHEPNLGSKIIETRFGKGISEITEDFETVFFASTQDWFDSYGQIPVILSGMIGSTIGWKDAPYISCPVGAHEISQGRIEFDARGISFSILAGLRTTNPLNLPDVMRGEELQLLGWKQLNADFQDERLFALPGTHNKWTLLKSNKVETFLSAFTGELFGILTKHSILIANSKDAPAMEFDQAAFQKGVETAQVLGEANILHALFSVRSRHVLGEIEPHQSKSYLSGLIIAADIIGAYSEFSELSDKRLGVTIIGEPELSQNYHSVCTHLDIESECISPSAVAIAGFSAIYQSIYE